MTGLRFRPAEAADHDWIVATVEDAYEQYVEAIGKRPAPMMEDYAGRIADGLVTIALHGDERVGMIVMWPVDQHLYVDSVAVPMAGQGLGVGTALLEHAAQHARALGLPEIRLYTNELMTANLTYYPRRGFTETHRGIEDGYTRVYFTKQVPGT
jgi:ribosomal protein S18 acetylase RimI-like enzyme